MADYIKFVLTDEAQERKPLSDKELQKLKRGELLEILLEQSRDNDALRQRVEAYEQEIISLKEQLESREIHIKEAGNLAEASMKLNGVFEAAQSAAAQYLENLQKLYEKEKYEIDGKEEALTTKCAAIIQATEIRCDVLRQEAKKRCAEMEETTKRKCDEMLAEAEQKASQWNNE